MLNTILRVLLALWVIGYLLAACVPMLLGSSPTTGMGPVAGAILLVPWFAGVVILVSLIWLTRRRRRG